MFTIRLLLLKSMFNRKPVVRRSSAAYGADAGNTACGGCIARGALQAVGCFSSGPMTREVWLGYLLLSTGCLTFRGASK